MLLHFTSLRYGSESFTKSVPNISKQRYWSFSIWDILLYRKRFGIAKVSQQLLRNVKNFFLFPLSVATRKPNFKKESVSSSHHYSLPYLADLLFTQLHYSSCSKMHFGICLSNVLDHLFGHRVYVQYVSEDPLHHVRPKTINTNHWIKHFRVFDADYFTLTWLSYVVHRPYATPEECSHQKESRAYHL